MVSTCAHPVNQNVQVVKRRREQAEAARADQIEGGARKRKVGPVHVAWCMFRATEGLG